MSTYIHVLHAWCSCCPLTCGFQRDFHLVSFEVWQGSKNERGSHWFHGKLSLGATSQARRKATQDQANSTREPVMLITHSHSQTISWLTTMIWLKLCFLCLGNVIYIMISTNQLSFQLSRCSFTIITFWNKTQKKLNYSPARILL